MAVMRSLALVLALILCSIPPAAAEETHQDDMSLSGLTQSLNATLEYDPLTHAGTITKAGHSIRFAVDVPYILLDWSTVKRVPSPYETEDSLRVKKEFSDALRDFFRQSLQLLPHIR